MTSNKLIKQKAHFSMRTFGHDIVALFNLAKSEHYKVPGKGYQKKLKELEEQLKQEQSLRQKSEEQTRIAEKTIEEKDDIIGLLNNKLRHFAKQNEAFVAYGRILSPRFVEESEENAKSGKHESALSAADGDDDKHV